MLPLPPSIPIFFPHDFLLFSTILWTLKLWCLLLSVLFPEGSQSLGQCLAHHWYVKNVYWMRISQDVWAGRNLGDHSFSWMRPREAKRLTQDHTTWRLSMWNQQAGGPDSGYGDVCTMSYCPLPMQKSPLHQCEARPTYLAFSFCSEPTPFIPIQWSKLFWRRKSGPAGMFPILLLCRLLCTEKRRKVTQKTERAKLLHNWHKRVTTDKECSSGGQWLFWRLKWMD